LNPRVATWAKREDVSRRFDELDDPWPEFMYHDAVVNANWGAMRERFSHLQIVLFDADDGECPIGRGQTLPVRWDGTLEGLPGGVDDATLQAVALADGEADTLSAMVASLDPRVRGQGLSRLIIDGMRRAAAAAGLKALIAPVRPTLKQLYPLVPMERYVEWRRGDGLLFDPWLRLHERLGAKLLRVASASMTIRGTVAEWELWAAMAFPESGDYVVPGALAPVEIDRGRDRGVYVEPNVWMLHSV
jgi:GNAT superfamily N-acetyltransferase